MTENNKINKSQVIYKTEQQLMFTLSKSKGHYGELLSITGDKEGYDDLSMFIEDLEDAIKDVVDKYQGNK